MVTAYPTLRLQLSMPQALKLQFLPAIPGTNSQAAADRAEQAAQDAQNAANTAVAATANKVDRTGDAMTGFLTLNADPTSVLHAATKQYVDAHSGGGGGTGNVISVPTPTNGQLAKWTDATHIQGVDVSSLSLQPLDADLTAIAALTGTNTIYYRSAASTWSPVNISTGLAFSGGNLTATATAGAPIGAEYITSTADATLTNERVITDTATITWDRTTPGQIKASTAAGGGNVSNSGTPTAGQYGKWVTATTIQGVSTATVLSDIGAAPLNAPVFTGDARAVTPTAGDNDTSIATTAFVTAAVAAAPGGRPQGRLTLQTVTPVMTTTQSAKTTIFYTPYVGNQTPIYNGTTMTMTTFTELSNATAQSSTGNAGPAAVAASSVYDLFVWSNAGTITLTRGPVWTSDTARSAGTALVMVAGILLNSVSITNGPAASRGTYVGTVRSNASSQIDWIYGAPGSPPTASALHVWNAYNRARVASFVGDTTSSWVYGSATVREANANTTFIHSFVTGLAEDALMATNIQMAVRLAGGDAPLVGIGYDTTSAMTISIFGGSAQANSVSVAYVTNPAIGRHFVAALEAGGPTNSPNFYGGLSGFYQTGLFIDFRM